MGKKVQSDNDNIYLTNMRSPVCHGWQGVRLIFTLGLKSETVQKTVFPTVYPSPFRHPLSRGARYSKEQARVTQCCGPFPRLPQPWWAIPPSLLSTAESHLDRKGKESGGRGSVGKKSSIKQRQYSFNKNEFFCLSRLARGETDFHTRTQVGNCLKTVFQQCTHLLVRHPLSRGARDSKEQARVTQCCGPFPRLPQPWWAIPPSLLSTAESHLDRKGKGEWWERVCGEKKFNQTTTIFI